MTPVIVDFVDDADEQRLVAEAVMLRAAYGAIAGPDARVAYTEDQPRDERGRWTEVEGGGDGDQEHLPGIEPATAEERSIGTARRFAEAQTGHPTKYIADTQLGYDENGQMREPDDPTLYFQPGTPGALTESVGQYVESFTNASDIYEAAQVWLGQQPVEETDVPPDSFAYAREILNAMAGENGDLVEQAYSPFAVGSEDAGANNMLLFDASTGDNLVRGVGDREGPDNTTLVENMRDAMASGETVSWPMASFVWGEEYDYYVGAIENMGGDVDQHTPDQSALGYATKDGYNPVLISLQGTTEGALCIDGEYEVLTGGTFKVVDVREEEIPTGITDPAEDVNAEFFQFEKVDEETGEFVLDENGDPVELDEPIYIGPTTTVTRVVVEQVEPPKRVG